MIKNSSENSQERYTLFYKYAICIAALLATILSILATATILHQHQSMGNLVADINRVQASMKDVMAFLPNMKEGIAYGEAGNDILDLNAGLANVAVPETINYAKEISKLCDDEIERTIENYQYQQVITAAQRKAAATPGMVGTLIVPSVGINVPLFYVDLYAAGTAGTQAVVDNPHSCAYIIGSIPGAAVLADHQNQDFGALDGVRVGATGAIVTADAVIDIIATTVMDGHNVGPLVDKNMNPIGAIAPYIAYTCQGDWHNIRIVGFSER